MKKLQNYLLIMILMYSYNKLLNLEKEKDKFSMNTKLKINNTIKDVKITVQVIYDGEEALGILGNIEIL